MACFRRTVLLLTYALFSAQFASAFTPTIRFSEFLRNTPGTDDGREYFEISGPAGTSLDGLTLLEIEGDGGASGVIDGVFDLTGLSLGSNGLLLLRDQSMIDVGGNIVPAILSPAPAAETTNYVEANFQVGDYNGDSRVDAADYTAWRDLLDSGSGTLLNDSTPGAISTDDYDVWAENYGLTRGFFNRAGDVENDSITFALVRGFTGLPDLDLDTDNDGTLDVLPWTEVLDAVGFNESGFADGGDGTLINNSYGVQLGGIDFNGNPTDGTQAVAGFGDEPDGYILLDDGAGGYIQAVFDADESNEADPELFFDDGSGTLSLIDTAALGPWSLDDSPGVPEMVAYDSNGDLFYVTPSVTLVTGDLIGAPGLSIVGADGQPISLFLLSPGNLNGSGVLSTPIVAATLATGGAVPEPSSWVLAGLAVAALGRLADRKRNARR